MPEPLYADWFQAVVPAVRRAVADHNTGAAKAITGKAVFLVIQSYHEQQPGGKYGLPATHQNRLFNLQAEVTWSGNKMSGVVPGQEQEGVTIGNLKQGEGPTDQTRVPLTSPTFYYDSPWRSAAHFLSSLARRYPAAYAVLTDPAGQFDAYAHALKRSKYATDAAYDTRLINIKGQVLRQLNGWLKYRLEVAGERVAAAAGLRPAGPDPGGIRIRTRAERWAAEEAWLKDFQREVAIFK